jgi:hypothetical protein
LKKRLGQIAAGKVKAIEIERLNAQVFDFDGAKGGT